LASVTWKKRIPFDMLLSRSYWTWRANPALSVATMFSTGLTALAESIIGIFGLALLVRLEGTTWLDQIARDIANSNSGDLLNLVRSPSFLLTILEYMVPALLLSAVVLVLAGGFVYSAEYGSYLQAAAGSHVGVSEVMVNFVKRWKPMAWTSFLSYVLTILPVAIVLVVGTVYFSLAGATLVALLLFALVLFVGTILTVAQALLFIYTPVVVVADNLSGLAAIRRSATQVRRNFGTSFAYGVVLVVLTGAVSYITALVPIVNLPLSSLASVGILILITPVLHLLKTEIYSEAQKTEPVSFVVYSTFLSDLIGALPRMLWSKFVRGLRELKDFALNSRNAIYHALSAVGLVLGWWLGVWIGNSGLVPALYLMGYAPGRINPLVTGSAPLVVGFYVFFHNWETALATALSGVWFPLIPFVTLLLNGALVGVVSDLVPNTTMLVAALAPHGVIELPSFVLAGSAGIRLGVAFYKSMRSPGPQTDQELHTVARQTVYVVIGLALLFFIAGAIEGNVTPVIMRMAGWK